MHKIICVFPFYGLYCTLPFAKINLIITIPGNKMVKNGIRMRYIFLQSATSKFIIQCIEHNIPNLIEHQIFSPK